MHSYSCFLEEYDLVQRLQDDVADVADFVDDDDRDDGGGCAHFQPKV